MVKQDGLEWIHDTFGLEPRWAVEPKCEIVESLARKHLTLDGDARCKVQFYAQGAFNKLYRVDTDNGTFLMRVSLPVDPHHKTMSEVATIKFVRQQTEMPVPKIIVFDGSNDNDLGFEWILINGADARSTLAQEMEETSHAQQGRIGQAAGALSGRTLPEEI